MAPNTLLHPHPGPLHEGEHVLPCKTIVRELESALSLRTGCLYGIAQVARLVGPPVREPQAVLVEVVANDEDKECWDLTTRHNQSGAQQKSWFQGRVVSLTLM